LTRWFVVSFMNLIYLNLFLKQKETKLKRQLSLLAFFLFSI